MKPEARVFGMASQSFFCCVVVIYYCIVLFTKLVCKLFKVGLVVTFFGSHFRMCLREMDASTANSRFRLPRTVEEESALVSEARPSSTKYKDKWAVEIFREWQRTRALKFLDLEVGSVFKDYDFHLVCSVANNLEDMDALSFNY